MGKKIALVVVAVCIVLFVAFSGGNNLYYQEPLSAFLFVYFFMLFVKNIFLLIRSRLKKTPSPSGKLIGAQFLAFLGGFMQMGSTTNPNMLPPAFFIAAIVLYILSRRTIKKSNEV